MSAPAPATVNATMAGTTTAGSSAPAPASASASSRPTNPTPSNERGIPYAPFIDKVESYITDRSQVSSTLKKFEEMISKYQFMEANTSRRADGLRGKIPDIQRTLEMVRFLKTRRKSEGSEDEEDGSEPMETLFELNDTLYARAHVGATDEVYLWLGANVMLSYPIDEAETLLVNKLATAKSGLANCETDADFLREQITTLEVATARVYNWDVSQRRMEEASSSVSSAGKSGEGGSGGKKS